MVCGRKGPSFSSFHLVRHQQVHSLDVAKSLVVIFNTSVATLSRAEYLFSVTEHTFFRDCENDAG